MSARSPTRSLAGRSSLCASSSAPFIRGEASICAPASTSSPRTTPSSRHRPTTRRRCSPIWRSASRILPGAEGLLDDWQLRGSGSIVAQLLLDLDPYIAAIAPRRVAQQLAFGHADFCAGLHVPLPEMLGAGEHAVLANAGD